MDLVNFQIFPNFQQLLAVAGILKMLLEPFFLSEALVAVPTSEHGHL